jgi:predicted transcriptional regulator YheO
MTFGDLCEVVIHDFSDPEHSIIFIEGNVTGRSVGGSIGEIGLAAMRGGDSQPDDIGYVRNTRDGRILRASTLLLRDPEGHVFGCLCINLDISSIVALQRGLGRLFPTAEVNPVPVEFSNRMEEVMSRLLGEALSSMGFQRPPALMNRDERLRFIAELDRRGAFAVQRAVPTVARQLQVSRTTVYTYLDEARSMATSGHSQAINSQTQPTAK